MSVQPVTELPGDILKLPMAMERSAETRMKDALACQRMVQQMIREDMERSNRRAIVKGCYDGNPPKSRLRPGYSWECNLNFGEMEGLLDSARIPYYALLSGVKTYSVFDSDFQRDNPDYSKWGNIVAEEWTYMLNRWKQFRWHNRAREFEMLFEGWGPVIFEDPNDWRFTAIPARCVKVPKQSFSVVDDRMPFMVVLKDWRVHELWRKIADEQTAAERGWNVAQVKYLITYGCNRRSSTAGQYDYEYWEQRLKNGDYSVSYSDSDIIRCATVFVKEYSQDGKSGKISEFIISADFIGQPGNDESIPEVMKGYLYSQPNLYESYDEAINVAFQNTGDGTWHSVRGLAFKSFKHVELNNRLLGQSVNNAFLASTPIIEPGTNQAKDAVQLMVLGPVATLQPGAKVAETRLGQDISGVLAVNRVITAHLAQNIGHYNQRTISRDDGRGEMPTATQVELQANKETSLSQAQIDSYYDSYDLLYEQMFNRAKRKPDSESRLFIQNCLDRGVPQEFIDGIYCVRANRLSGYPSPGMRERAVNAAMGIVGMLPTQGRLNLLDEFISVTFGPEKIDVFNPKLQQPNLDAALATLENGSMKEGVTPIIISGMDDATHLQIHLQYAAQEMQPLRDEMEQQGQIPPDELEKAFQYISILGPHCDQHLQRMERDPSRKNEVALFQQQLKNLGDFHGKLRGAIIHARNEAKQAQLEQQNATALGVMDQAKLASTQAEIHRQDVKAAADIRRKDWKTHQAQVTTTWKTGQNVRLNAAKTAADTNIKRNASEAQAEAKKKAA